MDLSSIHVIGTPHDCATPEQLHRAEQHLGLTLPSGYHQYVTHLGAGVLGGTYVRIYVPEEILSGENSVTAWRQRINEYWFWGPGQTGLGKSQVIAGVVIGDTLDGDELFVLASHPGAIFVLPRHSEEILLAGNDFWSALDWICGSGVLTEPFNERIFEPN